MTEPMAGGRRRVDRVLSEDFLAGLEELELEQVRALRREAEQEEVDLSYIRRMLQGRMDIIRAELARRSEPRDADEHIVAHLAHVLADSPNRTTHGLGRHITLEPSRLDEHRRAVEQIVADVGISDIEARSDDELRDALERLADHERRVSEIRHRVQQVMDRCTAEVGRRYRDGVVSVEDVLPGS